MDVCLYKYAVLKDLRIVMECRLPQHLVLRHSIRQYTSQHLKVYITQLRRIVRRM